MTDPYEKETRLWLIEVDEVELQALYDALEHKIEMTDAERSVYRALDNRRPADGYEALRDGVLRHAVILDWLRENMPRALELCPYKIRGEAARIGDR